ncbi:NAC domain-containing protein 18-like [Silene latifolia]|uniref:NAC domain-containing protein 18-like n=1 Tax=Silene latifolia TaxID=37657 RepID=UPI003D77EFC7
MDVELPPGYRFMPEKQELVNYYLYRKLHGETLPTLRPRFIEANVYSDHPYNLLKSTRERREIKENEDDIEAYFFTELKKSTKNGRRISRSVGQWGTWKEQNTKDVEAYDTCCNVMKVVGIYKYFKFMPASGSQIIEDNDGAEWQMHEYSMTNNRDMVLCHIVTKNAKIASNAVNKRNHATMCSSMDHECDTSKRSRLEDSPVESPFNSLQSIPDVRHYRNQSICSSTPLHD